MLTIKLQSSVYNARCIGVKILKLAIRQTGTEFNEFELRRWSRATTGSNLNHRAYSKLKIIKGFESVIRIWTGGRLFSNLANPLNTIPGKGNQTLLKVRWKTLVQDKWNGFGGKVEKGETIPAAAARNLTRYVSLNIFSPWSPDSYNSWLLVLKRSVPEKLKGV